MPPRPFTVSPVSQPFGCVRSSNCPYAHAEPTNPNRNWLPLSCFCVQDLGIYTSQLIDEYYGSQMFELPPHLYAVANEAYYQMKEETSDQCTFLCLFLFV
jgi:hypothetical protein